MPEDPRLGLLYVAIAMIAIGIFLMVISREKKLTTKVVKRQNGHDTEIFCTIEEMLDDIEGSSEIR